MTPAIISAIHPRADGRPSLAAVHDAIHAAAWALARRLSVVSMVKGSRGCTGRSLEQGLSGKRGMEEGAIMLRDKTQDVNDKLYVGTRKDRYGIVHYDSGVRSKCASWPLCYLPRQARGRLRNDVVTCLPCLAIALGPL